MSKSRIKLEDLRLTAKYHNRYEDPNTGNTISRDLEVTSYWDDAENDRVIVLNDLVTGNEFFMCAEKEWKSVRKIIDGVVK